jgi:DNA-binding beta-propeller fold protein YncE
MLSTARSLAVSAHGNPHVVQFLANGSFAIFPPGATGNVAPNRTIFTETNDLTAIAVDSHMRDYVLSVRQGPRVFVYHDGLSGQQLHRGMIADPNLAAVADIAIDPQQNLVMAGYDGNGQVRIDTFNTAAELGPEVDLVRSISGPRTGLLPGSPNPFSSWTMSIAVNSASGELFVFNAPGDGSTSSSSVSVFAAHANGDVPPLRVIGGSSTGIAGTGILGTNKIAVARDGRLFVAQPNDTILVFAPGVRGNVPPASTITDSTLGTTTRDQGGIAVR